MADRARRQSVRSCRFLFEVAVDPHGWIGALQDWRRPWPIPAPRRRSHRRVRRTAWASSGWLGLASVPALIAACSAPARPRPPRRPAAGRRPHPRPAGPRRAARRVSVGDYHTDTQGRRRTAGRRPSRRFDTAQAGVQVTVTTSVDHSTSRTVQLVPRRARPTTSLTWFSGYRMRFLARKGLLTPIDDVWADRRRNYTDGFKPGIHRRRRQEVLQCRSSTIRGSSSTARASSPTRATPSRRRGTSSRPWPRRSRPTASFRSPSPTRTAGRRWAPSTS